MPVQVVAIVSATITHDAEQEQFSLLVGHVSLAVFNFCLAPC